MMIRLNILYCFRISLRISLLIICAVATGCFFTSCEKYPCPPTPETPTELSGTLILQGNSVTKNTLIDTNFPTSVYYPFAILVAGTQGPGSEQQGLLDFNYSTVPAGATVTKAYLTLYSDTSNIYSLNPTSGHFVSAGTNAWRIRRITANWDQTTVTWNTCPASDAVNEILLPASDSTSQAYRIDVTQLVNAQLQNPTLYYGFLLQVQDNTTSYAYVSFCSSFHQHSSLHPKLEVSYYRP